MHLQTYYEKPLPKMKDLNAQIAKIESANVNNNKYLSKKKSDLKQMETIHSYLSYLNKEYEPPKPEPQRQTMEQTRQRKKSYGLDR
jgi:hypothetical protein